MDILNVIVDYNIGVFGIPLNIVIAISTAVFFMYGQYTVELNEDIKGEFKLENKLRLSILQFIANIIIYGVVTIIGYYISILTLGKLVKKFNGSVQSGTIILFMMIMFCTVTFFIGLYILHVLKVAVNERNNILCKALKNENKLDIFFKKHKTSIEKQIPTLFLIMAFASAYIGFDDRQELYVTFIWGSLVYLILDIVIKYRNSYIGIKKYKIKVQEKTYKGKIITMEDGFTVIKLNVGNRIIYIRTDLIDEIIEEREIQ